MNVYDFDNTILRGDSTARFFAWCFLRKPRLWLDIFGQIGNALLFITKRRGKQEFKQRMLRFITQLDDMEQEINAFWRVNIKRIKPFYKQIQRKDDVIISASPIFLIAPACAYLGITHVFGSPIDIKTGKYYGKNCHGEEKVRVFRAHFGDAKIDTFYSDSHSDDPLAQIAAKAVLVRGNRLLPWNEDKNYAKTIK